MDMWREMVGEETRKLLTLKTEWRWIPTFAGMTTGIRKG
jgi:hypothetical protein